MNLNRIIYNEDLTIYSQTEQPIRAFAQQANTIEILAPVSGYNTAYVILQGLASGVVNPRLRATERLLMSPLTDEGSYKRWNFVIPGAVLNDMSLMNSTGVRVTVEFWYIGGNCIGVEKYNTEIGIAALLAADYPSATDGQFVRVIDTNTDWYYDADTTTWIDYEDMYLVGVEAAPSTAADFALEKGIYTGSPSHAPTNTEYIISLLTAAGVDIAAIEALLAGAVLDVNGFKKVVYDVTAPATELGVGETRWNDTEKCLETRLSTDVIVQHSRELLRQCRNSTGSVIADGKVVYVTGATGQTPTIALADNTVYANADAIIGVTTQAIANNAVGEVCIGGIVNALNTSAFSDGDVVYLGMGGAITATKPVAPIAIVRIGQILYSHGTLGKLLVDKQVYNKISDASDVTVTSITTDDILIWNGTKFVNATKAAFLQSVTDRLDTAEGEIDQLQTDVGAIETANPVKSVTMDGSTYVVTITYYDDTTTTIDLPAEMAFVSASYSDVTEDLTFTLQNGSTVAVPLDDLVGGLASEVFVNAEIGKIKDGTYTAKKAEQDADGNVITETYETKADATTKENTTALKLAKHDELIQDTQETLRKALNSDGVATADDDGTGIIALGKDVAPAPVRVKVEGLLLDSPNKFNLTTGTANGITYTISGNQITLSGTASAETTLILASGLTATNKAYVNQDYRSGTSAGVITLKNGATALNATYGTDYSGVVTLEDTTITLVIANGAVLTNVIYKVNVNVVTVLQTNKQYSPLYSTTFDLMSDAQIKAQMDLLVTDGTLPYALRGADMNVRLRATGINLFNKMLYATSYAYKIKVKPSTQYTWSASTAYKTYDINGVEVASGTATTVTTGSGTFYIAFSGIASVDTFMLVAGTAVPSTYAPYQDSDLYLQPNTIGYSLPNGIKDSIEIRDGKLYYVQRVQRYVLQASDIVTLLKTEVNVDIVYTKAFTGNASFTNSIDNKTYIENKIEVSAVYFDSLANIGKYATVSNQTIAFFVAKGIYASLAEAKTALAGTVIYYQLATPITTLLSTTGVLNAFSSGHIYIDYGIIKDIALYGTSASITNSDYPITELKSIFNVTTNTELAVSGATIASGGLSFTHSGITAGDIVIFIYGYGQGLRGLTTVTYYDDPMIVAGSGTTAGKVYKIVPTVVDANIVWTKVEI